MRRLRKAPQEMDAQARERQVCTRMAVLACFMVTGFTGIGVQLLQLQIRQADELRQQASALRLETKQLPAMRGSIMAMNGQILAQDRTLHDFYAETRHLTEPMIILPNLAAELAISKAELKLRYTPEQMVVAYRQHIVNKLAPRLQMPPADLDRVLTGSMAMPTLVRGLESEEAKDWNDFIQRNHLGGIRMRARAERFRPAGDRLFTTLGYVRNQQYDPATKVTLPRKGVDGVESLMEEHLRGIDGWEQVEMDARKRVTLPGFAGQISPPSNGSHAVLTIHMPIQRMVEEVAEQAFANHRPQRLMIALIQPSTGSIVAMASEPKEPLNTEGKPERRNMVVTDAVEPGSTMKIVTLSAALDVGEVSMSSKFYCHQGYYKEPGGDVWVRDDESFESLSVRDILIHSSNIGAYKVAKQLGQSRFHDYITRFGFGRTTALNMPRESAGLVWSLSKWKKPSLSRVAMGYELSVTPLQLAMAVSAIANHGKRMQPRLVDHILSPDRSRKTPLAPIMAEQVCSSQVARQITDALEGVVTEGTGKLAAVPNTRVAGKTGTAQRMDPKTKRYLPGHFVVSFAGFAPAQSPELTCVVILDDPKAEQASQLYGGKLAAPIFSQVMTQALDLLHATPGNEATKFDFVTTTSTEGDGQ
jgi:cell division protein FtsI/penicillin-binding protein 2